MTTDKWKARIRAIAGVPVALVDVTITRTILLDTTTLESCSGSLIEAGLQDAVDFSKSIEKLPKDVWKYTIVPWSDVDGERLKESAFASVISYLTKFSKMTWRVEGTGKDGYFGILNVAGYDKKIDLTSDSQLADFNNRLKESMEQLEKDLNDQKIDKHDHDLVKDVLDVMETTGQNVQNLKDIEAALQAAKDQAERDKWKDELSRGQEKADSDIYTGDFPGDYGDRFSGVA